MTVEEHYIVYPEGETMQIDRPLGINQVVDMNGTPIVFTKEAPRMIAYRIFRINTREDRGSRNHFYYAELMNMEQLQSYARFGM